MIAYNFKLVAFNPNNNQTPPKDRAYRENRHRITSASAFTLENILFKIMESRVFAILLSTFLVVAFITEKATSITYLQCPPFCRKYSPTKNQGKDREVK